MDSARALVAKGWGIAQVSRALSVSRVASSSAATTVKLRVTFSLDCCDREAIDCAASTGGYDSSTVQDVMLRSVEKRFGDRLPDTPVQWLTDNGSAYNAHETRRLVREPCTTAVNSPQSNGMAERFVKTMKEDYIAFMPKPDV